jgi:hypothetical protein
VLFRSCVVSEDKVTAEVILSGSDVSEDVCMINTSE